MSRLFTLFAVLAMLGVTAFAADPVFVTTDSTVTDSTNEDAMYMQSVSATDADSADTVTYTLLDAPGTMIIGGTSGTIMWTPGNDDVGDHAVSIAATDLAGGADTLDFTLTVVNINDAPTLDAYAPATPEVYSLTDDSVTFSVTVSDVDAGDAVTYAWTVDGAAAGTGAALTYSAGAETAVTVMVKATDGSTDTVSQTWTAVYTAAFPDSLTPTISMAAYRSNATLAVDDDVMEIVFTQNIDDATLPSTVDSLFTLTGTGTMAGAVLSTGETADDSILSIAFAAGDTMPAFTGDLLLLAADVLKGTNNITVAADTDAVVSMHVSNITTGTAYATVMEANNAAADGDTIIVTTGTYYDSISLRSVVIMAADPDADRPVLRYSGRHYSLQNWQGNEAVLTTRQGASPVICGFEMDGENINDSTDQVRQFITTGGSVINCVIHNCGTGIREGGLIEDCEIYDCGNGVYCRSNNTTVRGNVFHDNGTAYYQYRGNAKHIVNNEFYGNDAVTYLRECNDVVFESNLIHHNTRVMSLYTGYPAYRVNWIGNTITANERHGLEFHGGRAAVVQNNIIWGNGTEDTTSYFDLTAYNEADVSEYVNFNLIGTWNGNLDTLLTSVQAAGNKLDENPAFADSADYHLGIFSPATDGGNELSDEEDYDGSTIDLGAYGGDNALDTGMPAQLDGFTVVRAGGTDSLYWDESADDDLAWYVIVRVNVDSGIGNPGAWELVDTVDDKATTAMTADNSGSKWLYTIQVMDSSGYGGGYRHAYSTTGGEIVVIPETAVDFGNVELGASEYRMVALGNAGVADLTVSGISLTDTNSVITVSDTDGVALSLPLVLAPDEFFPVVLTFTADTIYDIADELVIKSDDGDAADTMIILDVVGATAIEVVGLDRSAIDFGDEVTGVRSNRVYLYIQNNGTADLDIDSIWYADGTNFLTTSATTARTVPVGGSYRMSMYSEPVDTGSLTDTLYVMTSDPVTPVIGCVMTATATAPVITVTPADTAFGPVQVDSTSDPLTVSIGNAGPGALVIESVTFADGTVMSYTDSLTFPLTLANGETQDLSCIYIPADSSVVTDTLLITTNDPVTPVARVILRGSGPVSISDHVPASAPVRLTVGPNPVVNGMEVRFSLAKAALVDVSLYDVRGSHVMQLASQVFPAGTSRVSWTGDLAPGQYLVVIEGNGIYHSAQVTVQR